MFKSIKFLKSLIIKNKAMYLDKRSKEGIILFFFAHKQILDTVNKKIKLFNNTRIYNMLSMYFEKELLDSYYRKEFRLLIQDEFNYQISKKFNEEDNIDTFIKQINIEQLKYDYLVKRFLTKIRNKLKNYFQFIIQIFKKSTSQHNILSDTHSTSIGIAYVEGIDTYNRSDIFWLQFTKIEKRKVILYAPSIDKTLNKNSIDVINAIKNKLILYDLNNFHLKKTPDFLKDLASKVKILSSNNNYDKWFISKTFDLIEEVNYWYQFFNTFNIKIHLDNSEGNWISIEKQIALKLTNGLSIGKARSYPMRSFSPEFYPRDIYFCWGLDSLNELKESSNPIKNYIISGFPYTFTPKHYRKEKSFFTILVIDNVHSYNHDNLQLIYTPYLKNFYESIFSFFLKNKNIKIIVKPKKEISNTPICKKLLDKIKLTNRCKIIEDGSNKMSGNFALMSDLVISTSIYMPSALMECIVAGTRGVLCDYSNLRNERKDLYQIGFNKFIFDDVKNLIDNLEKFLKEPSNYDEFGNWKKIIDDIDPFRDNNGSKRIGFYIEKIFSEIENKVPIKKAIKKTNKIYLDEINKNFNKKNFNKNEVIFEK